MGSFRNDATGVVVSVADHKDERFANGWSPYVGEESEASDGAPRGNASREEWAEYATSKGVEFAEDAKRDDIKAAIEAAVVPE